MGWEGKCKMQNVEMQKANCPTPPEIGAGLGVGNVLANSLQGMTGNQGSAAAPAASGGGGGAAPSGGTPDVMTPSEAAQVLRVSEEDVVAAIEAGDLRARKLGSAYRISKKALDEFLGG